METVEALKIQISSLSKNELEELMKYMHNLENSDKGSLMDNLKNIKIDAPKDFSGNIDNFLYSGNA